MSGDANAEAAMSAMRRVLRRAFENTDAERQREPATDPLAALWDRLFPGEAPPFVLHPPASRLDDVLEAFTDDDKARLLGIAEAIDFAVDEGTLNRDFAGRDTRYLRQLADRLTKARTAARGEAG